MKQFIKIHNHRIIALSAIVDVQMDEYGSVFINLSDDRLIELTSEEPETARVWAWFEAHADFIGINPADEVCPF